VFFCEIQFLQIKLVVCNTRISLSCSHSRSLSRSLGRILTLSLALLFSCSPVLFALTRLRCRSRALVLSLPHTHSSSFSLPPISPALLLALSRALLLAFYLARSLSLFFRSLPVALFLSHTLSLSLAGSVCLSISRSPYLSRSIAYSLSRALFRVRALFPHGNLLFWTHNTQHTCRLHTKKNSSMKIYVNYVHLCVCMSAFTYVRTCIMRK